MALETSQNCRKGVSEYERGHFTRDVRVSFDVLGKTCWTPEICSPAEIVQSFNVNKNTVTLLMRAAGVACHRYRSTCDVKFSRLAVDKTYFGERKYNMGKHVRSRGYWFVTATELNIDGSTGRTV